jgi:hypothetical protein
MRPAQQAALQKGRVLMSTGNRPLTKTIRSSHANHEASSIDIVQQQRKFGKVILRRLLGFGAIQTIRGKRSGFVTGVSSVARC